MLLGYSMVIHDNDHTMFENVILNPCAKYRNVYELNIIDPNFRLKKKCSNISCTYDGFVIVSEAFKQFCEREKYRGLEFVNLPLNDNFYWFKIQNIVEYDIEARKTRFINYNAKCKGYEQIIGATPVCLRKHIKLEDGFFRSDVCFGSYAGKAPVEMVGELTKRKLQAAGFKEVYFKEILDKYDWQKKI